MKEQLENVVLRMYAAGLSCSEAVREFQKAFILLVLKDQRGNQCKAAKKLGVHRNTLHRTIRDLEIDIRTTRAMWRRRPAQSEPSVLSTRRRAS
jgi:Fis family transcriptional regulator, factor for inversion stimulation protein